MASYFNFCVWNPLYNHLHNSDLDNIASEDVIV